MPSIAVVTGSAAARKLTPAHIGKLLTAILMPAALLFGGAGQMNWPAAWAYLVFLIGGGTAAIGIMARRHPALLRERSERWREGKSWDKPFLLVIGVLGPSIVQLVSGLDKRFAWSALPSVAVQLAGAAVFLSGTVLTAWAIAVNPFFSAVVRIQTDRGHHAVAAGPYARVRHPGYCGMILCTLATPVLLGAWWGLVPALLLVGAVGARTALEDATLRAELPGYAEYSRRVRFRLVPGIW